ncbi:hypothetical protein BY996DRAFT_8399894 [Phakopsora pachyrhizi]|nr:hypothetical protein BY996DRAFT_8399894 [Phakopsora pachyrhizi]
MRFINRAAGGILKDDTRWWMITRRMNRLERPDDRLSSSYICKVLEKLSTNLTTPLTPPQAWTLVSPLIRDGLHNFGVVGWSSARIVRDWETKEFLNLDPMVGIINSSTKIREL